MLKINCISISDDGIGFDINQLQKGIGLHNMRKRVEMIHGKFELDTNDKGTRVAVVLNI
jgi:signal transduction histidine kinase